MDFGLPNAKIGRKMASGQLLFLVLPIHLVSNSVGTNPQFKDGIKYSLKVVLFSVIVQCITFLTAMSSSCVPNN